MKTSALPYVVSEIRISKSMSPLHISMHGMKRGNFIAIQQKGQSIVMGFCCNKSVFFRLTILTLSSALD